MALRLPCPPHKVNLIFINPLNFLVPMKSHIDINIFTTKKYHSEVVSFTFIVDSLH